MRRMAPARVCTITVIGLGACTAAAFPAMAAPTTINPTGPPSAEWSVYSFDGPRSQPTDNASIAQDAGRPDVARETARPKHPERPERATSDPVRTRAPSPVVPTTTQPPSAAPMTAQDQSVSVTVTVTLPQPLPGWNVLPQPGPSSPEQSATEPTPTEFSPAPSPTPTESSPAPSSAGVAGLERARTKGWSSGAAGEGVADHSFSRWRGSPVTIIGLWADTTAEVQEQVSALASEYHGWDGDIDIAVGGTVLGSNESYAEAARGAYLTRWTTMAKNLQRYRGTSGGVTYVRPFHEWNGSWYENWFVTPDNVEDYRAAFRLIADTVREHCPACVIAWSPNNGSSPGAAAVETAYPGDDVVDVISVDSYNANGNPVVTSPEAWERYANATKDGNPVGVESWRQFAERHGKPVAFSEWGLNPAGGGGDNPEYIAGMNAWLSRHAARPGEPDLAGKVLYDVYFNVAHKGSEGFLIKDGPNIQSGRAYQSLRWGAQPSGRPDPAAYHSPLEPSPTDDLAAPERTPWRGGGS